MKGDYVESLMNMSESYADREELADMLYDMIDAGEVDAEQIAKDLVYWCEDIEEFMKVRGLLPDQDEERDE